MTEGMGMSAPRKGQRESPDPPWIWKGVKFAGSVGHPMTKMLSASGGLRPLTRSSAAGPRWRLCPQDPRTRHGAPQPLIPSVAYGPPLEKILCAPLVRSGNGKEEREGEGWKGAGGRKRGERYGMGRNFPPWLSSRHLGRRLWCHVLAPVVHVKKLYDTLAKWERSIFP